MGEVKPMSEYLPPITESLYPAFFISTSAAIATVWARGAGPEARDEDFQSKSRLFPLAPSLAPMAWTVGTLLRRILEVNVSIA